MQYSNPRWLIRRDLPECVDIERASFPDPWSQEQFIESLRHRNCIGMVVEGDMPIVGFVIYTLSKDRLIVANFAVHPDHRRRGVGSLMIQELKRKVIEHVGSDGESCRDFLEIHVCEDNEPMHAFLKSQSFDAQRVDREFYDGRDGYCFMWESYYDALTEVSQ